MEEVIAQIVSKIRASKTIPELQRLHSLVQDVFTAQSFEKYFEAEFTLKLNQLQREG